MKSQHVFIIATLALALAVPAVAEDIRVPLQPAAVEVTPSRVEAPAPAPPAVASPARAPEAPAPPAAGGGILTPSVRSALADLLNALLLAVGGAILAAWKSWIDSLKARQKYDAAKTALVAIDEAAETAFRLKWEARSKYLVDGLRNGTISPENYKAEMQAIGGDALDMARDIAVRTVANVKDHVGDLDQQLRARLETLLSRAKAEVGSFFSPGNSPSAPTAAPTGGSK